MVKTYSYVYHMINIRVAQVAGSRDARRSMARTGAEVRKSGNQELEQVGDTSLARIHRNQQNASRSTGPKTVRGKRISSRNALRHGLSSSDIVVDDDFETQAAFDALLRKFRQDLQPEGALEELLVYHIVIYTWRLQRTFRYEKWELQRSMQVVRPELAMEALVGPGYREGMARMLGPAPSPDGVEPEQVLKIAVRALEEDLPFPPQFPSWLRDALPEEDAALVRLLIKYIDKITEAPSKNEDPGPYRAVALDLVNLKLGAIRAAKAEQRDSLREEIKHGEFEAPPTLFGAAEAMGQVLKYEAMLQRQLHRAIADLERLQRRRLGEFVPPPLNLNLQVENN